MHIPDGFIDLKTAATTAVLSMAGVGLALNRVRRELPPRRVPLLGLSAAFVFAAGPATRSAGIWSPNAACTPSTA